MGAAGSTNVIFVAASGGSVHSDQNGPTASAATSSLAIRFSPLPQASLLPGHSSAIRWLRYFPREAGSDPRLEKIRWRIILKNHRIHKAQKLPLTFVERDGMPFPPRMLPRIPCGP